MSLATFTLSAFGDEISPDVQEQLLVLRKLTIDYLELRGAWNKNVLHLDDKEVDLVRQICNAQGIAISCIGSPVSYTHLTLPTTPYV